MFTNPPQILSYPLLDSTMDEARRLLEAERVDTDALTVILADTQTQARGRHQRSWYSPPGNFYASFIMPWSYSLNRVGQMSFVYALAVTEALQTYLPPTLLLQCKWPNDILLAGGKLAGILLETYTSLRESKVFLITGVGINLVAAPEGSELLQATFLQAHLQKPVPIPALLRSISESLEKWYTLWNREGFSPIREAWLACAQAYGKTMTVRLEKNGAPIRGRFIDLDKQGALVFETFAGARHHIYAGDVFFDGR